MTRSPFFDAIRSKPWLRDQPFPVGITMLTDEELLLLRWIAKTAYSAEGLLLDCGCFLGGSTTAFAVGLRERPVISRKIHSFDLFVAGEFEARAYAHEGLRLGQSFRALYDANIAPFQDLVEVHEGDITQSSFPDGEIEILFVDCAKVPAVNNYFVTKLFPRLVPGRSIIIQQDYLCQDLPWIHITMEYFSEYFELLGTTEYNCAIYGCVKRIPSKAAVGCAWNMMSKSVKHLLMQRAINRWEGHNRQLLIGAYASYDLDADTWGWIVTPR
jgi:hypothetical protein